MNEPDFSSSFPSPAVQGIQLIPGGRWLFYYPRPQEPDQFARMMPLLDASLIEQAAGLLRHVWRLHHRPALWLLYLDPHAQTWHPHLPPQYATEERVVTDLAFGGYVPPPPYLRLAGSFFSVPAANQIDLPHLLPAFDGFHLAMPVPGDWLPLSAFVRIDDTFLPVPVAHVMGEPPARCHQPLMDRIRAAKDG